MKLSEGVEWGVHCAVVLAGLAPGATLPGKALAEYHGVSESYLLKHLKALTAAELLVSVPGPRGGYRLARTPERITLLDVVQAIDGTQPAFRCTAAMLRAESAWRAELERTSLADIVSGVVATADPRVMARSAGWLECNGRPAQRA
jgi:Rrf2 family protein